MQITSKQGQWLGDIAVREAGSIEAVVEMAINDDRLIADRMSSGSFTQKPAPINKRELSIGDRLPESEKRRLLRLLAENWRFLFTIPSLLVHNIPNGENSFINKNRKNGNVKN